MSILLRILRGIPFVLLCCLFAPICIFLLLVGSPIAFLISCVVVSKHHDDGHDEKSIVYHTTPH